ncbi:MAG: hypothetical protein ACTJIB_13035, partial [Pseudoalteromonas prydzensis]
LAKVDPNQISKSQERVRLHYYVALANCYLQAGKFKLAIHTALSQLENSYNTRFLEEQAQLQFRWRVLTASKKSINWRIVI